MSLVQMFKENVIIIVQMYNKFRCLKKMSLVQMYNIFRL